MRCTRNWLTWSRKWQDEGPESHFGALDRSERRFRIERENMEFPRATVRMPHPHALRKFTCPRRWESAGSALRGPNIEDHVNPTRPATAEIESVLTAMLTAAEATGDGFLDVTARGLCKAV